MTSALACSSESSASSSNPAQNQEGTLGYLGILGRLVSWYDTHFQSQFLTTLNSPDYAVE